MCHTYLTDNGDALAGGASNDSTERERRSVEAITHLIPLRLVNVSAPCDEVGIEEIHHHVVAEGGLTEGKRADMLRGV